MLILTTYVGHLVPVNFNQGTTNFNPSGEDATSGRKFKSIKDQKMMKNFKKNVAWQNTGISIEKKRSGGRSTIMWFL